MRLRDANIQIKVEKFFTNAINVGDGGAVIMDIKGKSAPVAKTAF